MTDCNVLCSETTQQIKKNQAWKAYFSWNNVSYNFITGTRLFLNQFFGNETDAGESAKNSYVWNKAKYKHW